jgi:PAS domain S-box-containing protein
MESKIRKYRTTEDLQRQVEDLQRQLEEANDTIEAIRTGQVDALVVKGEEGHQLYTLKNADQTYRMFIEKMTEGAVTINNHGLILYSNSQFASMVNLPLSSVLGQSFDKFIAEEDKDYYANLFQKCWTQDCKGEVVLVGENTKIPVQLSLTTLELDEGISLSIILTDLTEQKETQKQLKENNERLEVAIKALEASNHDLQQFASVASHDLQEPLRKIQIFSNLLKEKQESFPESGFFITKIIDSATRMKTLILDILDYSRLSAEKQTFEIVNLNQLLTELLDDFELIIKEKNVEITYGNLPTLEINKGQIRQVFQNIISNAIKFSKKNSTPVISIKSMRIAERSFESEQSNNGSFWLISFSDNGIGFNEKYVSSIFTLFERLNSKDKYEGTGIGLAIAKKKIDKHGGLITAHSEEANPPTFLIILPDKQSKNSLS